MHGLQKLCIVLFTYVTNIYVVRWFKKCVILSIKCNIDVLCCVCAVGFCPI